MSSIIDGLRFGWSKNLDYGQRLIADLTNQQMTLQPCPPERPPANHPAWVFSHLNVYHPVIMCLIQGTTIEDPKSHVFGMESKPERDSSIYQTKEELLASFTAGHAQIDQLLADSNAQILDQPVKLERWKNVMPTTAHALPYLMLIHENIHFGQLSAWRRLQGMSSV